MNAAAVPPALRPLLETAAEYRRQCESFESAFAEILTDMEHLRGELHWKSQALSEAESELHKQREENERLLLRFEQFISSTNGAPTSTSDSIPWSEMQLELAELRRQLLETRDALTAEIGRSDHERSHSTNRTQQQIDSLMQERSALEAELAVARSRAAELHETLARQEREREATNAQIQQLRTLIEQQSEWIRDAFGAIAADGMKGSDSSIKTDPVVNSVATQFAKLQKDIAQRRKK